MSVDRSAHHPPTRVNCGACQLPAAVRRKQASDSVRAFFRLEAVWRASGRGSRLRGCPGPAKMSTGAAAFASRNDVFFALPVFAQFAGPAAAFTTAGWARRVKNAASGLRA